MKSPLIPVSVGELVDKITILRIKKEHLLDQTALANVARELGELQKVLDDYIVDGEDIKFFEGRLQAVNKDLWQIEDAIRLKEKERCFDSEFIELARRVYVTNDERAAIKRDINIAVGSVLVEEKSYSDYSSEG